MTEEFNVLVRNLDSSLFRYAHITGALEFYMLAHRSQVKVSLHLSR